MSGCCRGGGRLGIWILQCSLRRGRGGGDGVHLFGVFFKSNLHKTEHDAVGNEKLIDEISGRIKEVIARTPGADIERNVRAMLGSMFARLDLVTREEFDVQTAVLARTREKLTVLEARLAELEKAAKPN